MKYVATVTCDDYGFESPVLGKAFTSDSLDAVKRKIEELKAEIIAEHKIEDRYVHTDGNDGWNIDLDFGTILFRISETVEL